MAEAFLSTIWYRVARLAPRLRPHVRVSRHRYRGQPWYVLHDVAGGRVHRFTPAAWALIGRMDGQRSVDELWQDLASAGEEDAPTQDEVIRLLSQLHQQDLIQYAGSPDVADLLERYNRQAGQVLRQNLTNPMSFRLPLWDPDAFLTATIPFVRPLTGRLGLLLWGGVVLWGLAVLGQNWQRLAASLGDSLLSTQNIVISLFTYPLLKALHEGAHGWLAKARGAEVREAGLMFLVLFPVPYVDVSAAAAFPDRWHRAAVAAGGIFVETFVAALALIVWSGAETGTVSAVAYSLFTIGGLSTVLVNGNPLLKFDGYFVLTDAIGIPNLGPRATRYWAHLAERHLFGARTAKADPATPGERAWFLAYAPAAFAYRVSVTLGIATYVATRFFVLGVALAAWSLFTALVRPVVKALHHVATAPRLRKVRGRACAITFGGIAAAAAAAALVPVPLHSVTEGVVLIPEEAHLRARTSGFVRGVEAARGQAVAAGAALVNLDEPALAARIEALVWRVEEHRRRLAALEVSDRAGAEVARLQLAETGAELARERERALRLTLRAPAAGRFEPLIAPDGLPGRYLAEGDLVGYVLPDRPERLRVVVTQDDIALVRGGVRGVEVALAGHLGERHAARLIREVPSALNALPSAALGSAGGGPFLTDPADRDGLRTLEPVFLFDLALPADMAQAPFGARVAVRFDHGREPVAAQAWRRLRQAFLRIFNA